MRFFLELYERAVQHRDSSGQRCLRGRRIVHDSAWLIRRSRLVLDYPGVGPICGGSDRSEIIRQHVRAALAAGALLPLDGNRSWAGRGNGQKCRICNEPIGPNQIEHEVEAPDSVLVHQACLIIWRDESRRQR